MADFRRLKSIASRYDVEVARRPDRMRVCRRWVSIAALPAAAVVCLPFLFGDHRGLQSRPVSLPHRSFQQNCQVCHDRAFAPLHRLVTFSNDVHSVSEDACRQCHAESAQDHIDHTLVATPLLESLANDERTELESRFQKLGCAGCHQEHRGTSLLATVRDEHCTDCHLKSASATPGIDFMLAFEDFAQHPEFAVHVGTASDERERHRSVKLTTQTDGRRRDASRIRFNHHRHLDPELPNAQREKTSLTCQNCHELDSTGAYFQPPSFERHCQQCHQLGYRQTGVLPHESPSIIRGVLLDRLARNDTISDPAGDPLGGPIAENPDRSPEIEGAPKTEDRWSILQARLTELETSLFGEGDASLDAVDSRTMPKPRALLESACTKCHFTEQTTVDENTAWRIMPTAIPDRWLPYSTFRHDSHDSLQCAQCHSQGGAEIQTVDRSDFYPEPSAALAESPSIFASRTAEDILMPSIAVCHKCHSPEGSAFGSDRVRSDCLTCHIYHHEGLPNSSPSMLLDLLSLGGGGTPSKAN